MSVSIDSKVLELEGFSFFSLIEIQVITRFSLIRLRSIKTIFVHL